MGTCYCWCLRFCKDSSWVLALVFSVWACNRKVYSRISVMSAYVRSKAAYARQGSVVRIRVQLGQDCLHQGTWRVEEA